MGTTIESGVQFSSVTTTKGRFSKGPGEVTEVQGMQDSITLGQPSDQPVRFRDLDRATRSEYKEALQGLAGAGRIYVRGEQGELRRADPMEIKERLDAGQPVELVTRLGSESESSGRSSSYGFSQERGFFSHGLHETASSSSASSSQKVVYTTSPFSQWDSLEFVCPGQGVQGVAVLPASGNQVLVSSRFESEWNRRSIEQWGVFNTKEELSTASGYTRQNYQAD